jgi:hypothetical protein
MPGPKRSKTSDEANDFDVPALPAQVPPTPTVEADDEESDKPEKEPTAMVSPIETPEQRRRLREKRIAKAEEEQLRRLMRQFPVIARLVQEHQMLKQQLAQPK